MEFTQWLSNLSRNIPLDERIYHNSIRQWLVALATMAVLFVVLPIILAILRRRVEKLSQHRLVRWLLAVVVVLKQTRWWLLLAASIWLGLLWVELPERSRDIAQSAVIIVGLLQVGVWGAHLLQFYVNLNLEERLAEDPAEVTTVTAMGFVAKLVLYTVILLLILDNLGVDVTALIAGLGVGGIAVALAAQNILGDLFSSMSIVLDKPFVLGDFIIVGDLMGTVERIGLKTTRIRSLSGEQLVFSNSDLLSSRIRNYKRMQERRIVFSIGVTYDTTGEKVAAIPSILRAAVEAQEQVRFDRAHFAKYGDSALIFEVVYYVLKPDFNLYMDIQQAINLRLLREFTAQKIEFAFPTQTLHLFHETTPGQAPSQSGTVE